MRSIYDQHQKVLAAMAESQNAPLAWRRAHLAKSVPVDKMNHLMRAEVLIGAELRKLKDERLGEITDIVFNPDKSDMQYVLVSRGGFLGIGAKQMAIRWGDFRATPDRELYVLDVSPKLMSDAPTVDRGTFARTATAGWLQALDKYWNGALN